MKILDPQTKTAAAVCGAQTPSEDCSYRLTTLCVQTPCADGTLLYHTLTGELLLLEKPGEWEERRSDLIRRRFLVPEGFDEAAFVRKTLEVVSLLHGGKRPQSGEKNSFTVLTTTDCNARCPYCYEAGARRISMSRETALAVAGYIARVCGGTAVSLRWFGGEPLLGREAIDTISARLGELGVAYTSKMITNGYYLDAVTAQKAVSLWKLTDAQVTLDGRADTYNRVKAYKEGGDAYSRVLQNIESALAAGVAVHVRLNVSRENLPELNALSDELAARFAGKAGLSVYPSLIGDFAGSGRFEAENSDAEGFLALRKKLKDLGLAKEKPLRRELTVNACKASSDSCEVILPDGGLSKCDHEVWKDRCGSIYSEERDAERIAAWKERVWLPECGACPLMPRCFLLKKCALVNDHCAKHIQTIRLSALREQISDHYERRKEKNE